MHPPYAHGLWPMLYAFFGADGALDRGAMRAQVQASIAAGAAGIAVLGLATEVNKLSLAEKQMLVDWLAEDLAGRLPFACTIAEANVADAVAFGRAAKAAGAAWAIVQPAPVRGVPEAEHLAFFAAIADRLDLDLAIQNAAAYLGVAMSDAGLLALAERHPNLKLLKAEAPAAQVAATIAATRNRFAVMNGRGGLEITDNLRAGCVGMVPGVETCDVQARICAAMAAGDERTADRLYAELAPLLVFMMASVDWFLCYGKRLAARRLGLGAVHDRGPALRPDPFALACLSRWSATLGPLA